MRREWTAMLLAVTGMILASACSQGASATSEKTNPNDDPRAASMVAALTAATSKFPEALCSVGFDPPLKAGYRPYGHLRGAGAGLVFVCLPESPDPVLDKCAAELRKQKGITFDTQRPGCFGGFGVALNRVRGDDGPVDRVAFPCGQMKKITLRSVEDPEPTTSRVKFYYEPDDDQMAAYRALAAACKDVGGMVPSSGEAMLLKDGEKWTVLAPK